MNALVAAVAFAAWGPPQRATPFRPAACLQLASTELSVLRRQRSALGAHTL